jgi:predicted transcriptional regulator
MMKISYVMVPKDQVITVPCSATLKDCATLFLERRISSVVVIDDNRPAGVITKTNLIRAWSDGNSIADNVTKYMSDPEFIDAELTVGHAAQTMVDRKQHHLLVKDLQGQWIGLLSNQDIAREAASDARAWPFIRGGLRESW